MCIRDRAWESYCNGYRNADRSWKDCRTFEVNFGKTDTTSGEFGSLWKEAFHYDSDILRTLKMCIRDRVMTYIQERGSTHVYHVNRMSKEEMDHMISLCVHDQPAYCVAACPFKVDTKEMLFYASKGNFKKALAIYEKITPSVSYTHLRGSHRRW